jgi:hypothetical protein
MKRRNSITALYKWLIRRRTQIWYDLLLGVWTLANPVETNKKKMDKKAKTTSAESAQRNTVDCAEIYQRKKNQQRLHRRRPDTHPGLARR